MIPSPNGRYVFPTTLPGPLAKNVFCMDVRHVLDVKVVDATNCPTMQLNIRCNLGLSGTFNVQCPTARLSFLSCPFSSAHILCRARMEQGAL